MSETFISFLVFGLMDTLKSLICNSVNAHLDVHAATLTNFEGIHTLLI